MIKEVIADIKNNLDDWTYWNEDLCDIDADKRKREILSLIKELE